MQDSCLPAPPPTAGPGGPSSSPTAVSCSFGQHLLQNLQPSGSLTQPAGSLLRALSPWTRAAGWQCLHWPVKCSQGSPQLLPARERIFSTSPSENFAPRAQDRNHFQYFSVKLIWNAGGLPLLPRYPWTLHGPQATTFSRRTVAPSAISGADWMNPQTSFRVKNTGF